MSGHGTSGSKGLGKGGAKPAIPWFFMQNRLADLYTTTQIFLENVIRDFVTCTEHAKRKTVTSLNVVYVLKQQAQTLYVFGA
ncbi:hypothetical protein PTTG_07435 [Puccinia triticina 1-1 BBBD Race 1]|uniref:CENP-T/Histone H4 histone fold domain-containing protein n=1 Tax=Puccinia triticina (isolate 1-1 / race 1 (BBBD)) TaxID=630390 RepID=A0A180GNH0_PUCT1|nr:hypothetical protein PTTG_07435 [Puccinia triticina 1-1 BBBD Race 1]